MLDFRQIWYVHFSLHASTLGPSYPKHVKSSERFFRPTRYTVHHEYFGRFKTIIPNIALLVCMIKQENIKRFA